MQPLIASCVVTVALPSKSKLIHGFEHCAEDVLHLFSRSKSGTCSCKDMPGCVASSSSEHQVKG